ncbi:MAG TPA: Sir2 family NAD-dependent protein deacetylase [Saprospiraceae bacterium]|nr:Sir2 family NAD-dependent protein deacetylase [Saprospiraceae bacterium]
MQKVVVLTGAGMSAESGIKTFRDHDGLWENHDVTKVASPEGWAKNRDLVLDFYNKRRAQLTEVKPNAGHKGLVELEEHFDVQIITQNVDDLHERAGSNKVLHLHGELNKVRSTQYPELVYHWEKDLKMGDTCEKGYQLRPHIVWFGEGVPKIEPAVKLTSEADIIVIIGTSMQVYPAASLVAYAPRTAPIFYVDPRPSINYELQARRHLRTIEATATVGVQRLKRELLG